VLALATATLGGAVLLSLLAATHGWYWFWCFRLPSQQGRTSAAAVDGLWRVARFSPLLAAPPLLFAFLMGRRSLSSRGAFWFGMALAAAPAGLVALAKNGGSDNNFIPMLLPLGAIVLVLAHDFAAGKDAAKWAVCAVGAAYLLWQTYDFRRYAPSPDRWARAEAMNAEIAKLDGSVVVPGSPFLPIRNGKDWSQFTQMSYVDMAWANLPVDAERVLRENGARWVVLNSREPATSIERLVVQRYDYQGELPSYVAAWATIPTGPKDIYRRRAE
jgi:hypothetical protein